MVRIARKGKPSLKNIFKWAIDNSWKQHLLKSWKTFIITVFLMPGFSIFFIAYRRLINLIYTPTRRLPYENFMSVYRSYTKLVFITWLCVLFFILLIKMVVKVMKDFRTKNKKILDEL